MLSEHKPLLPLQALDTIAFEKEYEENSCELITIKPDPRPEAIKKATAKLTFWDKFFIHATYALSTLGMGLGCTTSVFMRFTAPIAIGGAGLVLGIPVLTGIMIGLGVLAIAIAAFSYRKYTNDTIKTSADLLNQLDRYKDKVDEKAIQVIDQFKIAFKLLVKIQLTLNKLQQTRKKKNSKNGQFDYEIKIEEKINYYIDFLVNNPDHPHLEQIEDMESRAEAKQRAYQRQYNIRQQIVSVCQMIEEKKISADNYFNGMTKEQWEPIRENCFPSLHLIAPKTKKPIVINKPTISFAFAGAFIGSTTLCYTAIAITNLFMVLPMAFPPAALIIGIGVMMGAGIAYCVYKTKQFEATQQTHINDQQKRLAYYNRAHKLLVEYNAKAHIAYHQQKIDHILTTHKKPQATPALTPESNMGTPAFKSSLSKEDLRFEETLEPNPTLPASSLS